MAKKKLGKGKVKGPIGGPAGVSMMHAGDMPEAAAPRPTKTARTGTKGYKAGMGKGA